MNQILTNGYERQIRAYARTRINNFFENGIKDSTVFCLGEDKTIIEANIRTYVDTISKELKFRGYRVNEKIFYHIRRFYIQIWSERIGNITDKNIMDSPKVYDVIKFTLGAAHDGIPAVFCYYYPVDTDNTDGEYVQPEFTLRVPLILGNTSVFRNRSDNKAAIFMFGISMESLSSVREHLSRLIQKPAEVQPSNEIEDDDSIPMIPVTEASNDDTLEDVMPENLNHATTMVDAIRQVRTSHA